MKSIRAFTLIEILVALALFALLASITASAMYQAFNVRARLSTQSDHLNTLQLALSRIQQDVGQITARDSYANDFQLIPAFIGRSNYIEFTRGGMSNPQGFEQRSTLQRVALLCQNNQLIRRTWPVIDMPDHERYHDTPLLLALKDCHFGFLHTSLQLFQDWDATNNMANKSVSILPKAIQLNLKLADGSEGSLLFLIPEAVYYHV